MRNGKQGSQPFVSCQTLFERLMSGALRKHQLSKNTNSGGKSEVTRHEILTSNFELQELRAECCNERSITCEHNHMSQMYIVYRSNLPTKTRDQLFETRTDTHSHSKNVGEVQTVSLETDKPLRK